MIKTILFSSNPKNFGIDIDTHENYFKYLWFNELYPDIKTVNSFFINERGKKVLFFDRIKGTEKPFIIKDHINVSGGSSLRGNTPFNELEMFPEMSKVYDYTQKKHPYKTVYTYGKNRFIDSKKEKRIVSEAAGIITPILKYLNIKVICFGIPIEQKHKKEFIKNIIKEKFFKEEPL